jgi:hypothetical protein
MKIKRKERCGKEEQGSRNKNRNTKIKKKNIYERRICHAIGQVRRGLTNQERRKSEISASFIRNADCKI